MKLKDAVRVLYGKKRNEHLVSPGSGIRDPGSGIRHPGSGIRHLNELFP